MARVHQLDAQHATHRAQKQIKPGRRVGTQITDNRLFHASGAEFQVDRDLRWKASLKITDRAVSGHPCELDPAAGVTECQHPDHDRDAEWAKEALDVLGLPGEDLTPVEDWQPDPPPVRQRARLSRSAVTRLDVTWHDRARCRGEALNLFFGGEGERRPERELREHRAKQVCGDCFFQARCLDQNIDEKSGVFGGTTPEERKIVRRRRMRRKRAA